MTTITLGRGPATRHLPSGWLGKRDWLTSSRDALTAAVPSGSGALVFDSSSEVLTPSYRPVSLTKREWLHAVLERLTSLAKERLITSTEAIEAFAVLIQSDLADWGRMPEPFVAPRTDGGFSLDFESEGIELELDFQAEGDVFAYVFDQEREWEGPLDALPDGLAKWAWRLSVRGA